MAGGNITKIQSIASVTSAKLHFGKTMTNKQTIHKQANYKQTNKQRMKNKQTNSNSSSQRKMASGYITRIQSIASVTSAKLQFTSMRLKFRTLATKI